MKVAWNLKGSGITGLCTSEDELKVLHDVFSAAVQPGAQKASYIVQFLWRNLTSSFDLIGSFFSNWKLHGFQCSSGTGNDDPQSIFQLRV